MHFAKTRREKMNKRADKKRWKRKWQEQNHFIQSEKKMSDDKKCQSVSETDAVATITVCCMAIVLKINSIFLVQKNIVWISHHHEQLRFHCYYRIFFSFSFQASTMVWFARLPKKHNFKTVILFRDVVAWFNSDSIYWQKWRRQT